MAVTNEQQRQFDTDGFFLIEDALAQDSVSRILSACDEVDACFRGAQWVGPDEAFQVRNALAHHEEFFKLVDHPDLLPLVVDLIGCNIQIRTSHLDVRPPMQAAAATGDLGAPGSFFPWHSDGPNFGYPITNGAVPFMEIKVGHYLTDLTEHNSGGICVVKGSHRLSPDLIHDPSFQINPEDIFEVNVKPGTAMIWRTALWHCLTPNLSTRTRKCLYYGYTHRWIRPSDYMHQPRDLLAKCTPIQRQLLGELGTGDTNYEGDDLAHPANRFWRPQEGDVPLEDWVKR
ncbi:MAG: hypothetical protein HOH43_02295 [Candidatus Latescibacteria bacterium]|jgi:ectoine hydroxylase-related dioxygenase (phytanoyl-CoA dioxygenase family)|nr:hypothetical protein [Candidatus Latescibacterota bacterium]